MLVGSVITGNIVCGQRNGPVVRFSLENIVLFAIGILGPFLGVANTGSNWGIFVYTGPVVIGLSVLECVEPVREKRPFV